MRSRASTADSFPVPAPTAAGPAAPPPRSDWSTLKRLFPYLWEYKWRALAALAFMLGAKLANVGV
ncbi:MAG: metal ABC transporter permease, partial [Polaromonas sp.]